jgi:hypothetical protein
MENKFNWIGFPSCSGGGESGALIVSGKGSLQHILKIKKPRDLRIQIEEDFELNCCAPGSDEDDIVLGDFKIIDAGRHGNDVWAIDIEWEVSRQRKVTWSVVGGV